MSSPPEDEPGVGLWTTGLSSFSADMVVGSDGSEGTRSENLQYPHGEMVNGYKSRSLGELTRLAQNIRLMRRFQTTTT